MTAVKGVLRDAVDPWALALLRTDPDTYIRSTRRETPLRGKGRVTTLRERRDRLSASDREDIDRIRADMEREAAGRGEEGAPT